MALAPFGLPPDFFQVDTGAQCTSRIITYRFVAWLSPDRVAVGFSTSPQCRLAADRKVDGMLRVLLFDGHGAPVAQRDLPYLADGYGELVADGEGKAGPGATLLLEFQSVNMVPDGSQESPSAVLLLDRNLKDAGRFGNFLEQTTLVDHAVIFQEGFTTRGPRTYFAVAGAPPVQSQRWTEDWPSGTLDRKFGEHALAYMLCRQELQPGVYSSSDVVYAGARRRCSLQVEAVPGGSGWSATLDDGDTAEIIGLLADGSVAARINPRESRAERLVIWRKERAPEALPWLARGEKGSFSSTTPDLSRYGVVATERESALCKHTGFGCSAAKAWVVFDRGTAQPLVRQALPHNARAALSPDGLRYASFQEGELRIYSLAGR